jgi:hypothetical protein
VEEEEAGGGGRRRRRRRMNDDEEDGLFKEDALKEKMCYDYGRWGGWGGCESGVILRISRADNGRSHPPPFLKFFENFRPDMVGSSSAPFPPLFSHFFSFQT